MLASKFLLRTTSVIALVLFGLFSACEDLDTISLEISQPIVFTVNETEANSNGKDYEVISTIDISQNPDLTDYLNRIEEVEINHIEYVISGASHQDIRLNNALIETSAGLDIISAESIALSNSSSGEFDLNAPGVNDLATRLKGSGGDNLKLFGDLTRTPLNCTVTVTFHLSIKARAI